METWKRFLDTVKSKPTDRVPVALLGTPRFFASLAKEKLFGCLHDPCKLMDVQLRAFEEFPDVTFIPGCWPDYGVGLFSAFGGRISWFGDSMPSIREYYFKSRPDIKYFRQPDPKIDGLMPWYLETLRLFVKRKDEFGNNLHFVHANGPGELGSHLWGLQNLLMNTHLKPELVKELLEKLTETIVTWIGAQCEVLDSAEGILLTDDVSGLVSPEAYKEFLLPYHSHIRERFKDYILVFHCDTRSDHILDLLVEAGIDVFNLGPTTDLATARARVGDRYCLMGNIDPVNIMQSRDVELVKKTAEDCLSKAMAGGGYILSVGGGLNEDTPRENIEAVIEVAELRGIYQ